MTIGEKIRLARKRANMTQALLAGKLGTHTNTVSRWETDERTPSIEEIHKLAIILKISPNWLISNEGPPDLKDATAFPEAVTGTAHIGFDQPAGAKQAAAIVVSPGAAKWNAGFTQGVRAPLPSTDDPTDEIVATMYAEAFMNLGEKQEWTREQRLETMKRLIRKLMKSSGYEE